MSCGVNSNGPQGALNEYYNRPVGAVHLPLSLPLPLSGPELAAKRRTFESGATRDSDDGKLEYEGFISPLVLQEFAKYMHGHRFMKDGSVRDADNWQNGFPEGVAEKSLCRHYMDFWIMDRQGVESYNRPDGEEVTKHDALMGILFNVQAITLQRLR